MISLKDCKSVTMTFPTDQNSNFYCSVIEEAIEKMPKLLKLMISIVDTDTENLTPSFAIKEAKLICEILSFKDRRHCALKSDRFDCDMFVSYVRRAVIKIKKCHE